MKERIQELLVEAHRQTKGGIYNGHPSEWSEKFAELIVREMCGLMEQTEDDCYHCFDASERPTEYIEWLRHWQERFEKHFGVK